MNPSRTDIMGSTPSPNPETALQRCGRLQAVLASTEGRSVRLQKWRWFLSVAVLLSFLGVLCQLTILLVGVPVFKDYILLVINVGSFVYLWRAAGRDEKLYDLLQASKAHIEAQLVDAHLEAEDPAFAQTLPSITGTQEPA